MIQEEKDLLLKDLCARLPYGVKVHYDMNADPYWDGDMSTNLYLDNNPTGDDNLRGFSCGYFKLDCADGIRAECIKPYLRPMSSMTEEEKHKLLKFGAVTRLENGEVIDVSCVGFERHADIQDYLNACHLDYRGLIEKGLALEAKEGMYN